MSDEKVPNVGEPLLWLDKDGDWVETSIDAVGECDPSTGLYTVECSDGSSHSVYWSDVDQYWVDSDYDEDDYNDED